MNEGQECFYFLTVNHNPMKMKKENKRKKVGVLTPNVAFLIAGLLFMASVSMLAADVVPVMDELKIESVNQKGRTITVTVLDEHGPATKWVVTSASISAISIPLMKRLS